MRKIVLALMLFMGLAAVAQAVDWGGTRVRLVSPASKTCWALRPAPPTASAVMLRPIRPSIRMPARIPASSTSPNMLRLQVAAAVCGMAIRPALAITGIIGVAAGVAVAVDVAIVAAVDMPAVMATAADMVSADTVTAGPAAVVPRRVPHRVLRFAVSVTIAKSLVATSGRIAAVK